MFVNIIEVKSFCNIKQLLNYSFEVKLLNKTSQKYKIFYNQQENKESDKRIFILVSNIYLKNKSSLRKNKFLIKAFGNIVECARRGCKKSVCSLRDLKKLTFFVPNYNDG